MNIVADTNIVISGLLWHGAPHQLLDLAREQKIRLYTSPFLLAELENVLSRQKFYQRLQQAKVGAEDLVWGYASLASVIQPKKISPVIYDDPDDDNVLACAVSSRADFIVSGDRHLLRLKKFDDIAILTIESILDKIP
ncbi:MAG: putative toxin-antitoxin system toxin component, PIN family [Chloroflexota bacterium]|nr:putative toxin-antitoxin system toxin component, PIN family [Chloroflexota bacterium]